jgi:membrane associated rhomboid family serine protease
LPSRNQQTGCALLLSLHPTAPAPLTQPQDVPSLAERGEWLRLLTAGLLHSGALAALVAIDAVREAGAWVEGACGGLTAGIVFTASAAAAALAQLTFGCAVCYLSGAGVAAGGYAAWAALALTRCRGLMPGTSDRAILYILLGLILAFHQPAVGPACLAGGAAGGAAALLLAPVLERGVMVATALPVVGALTALRVAVETARLALAFVWTLVVTTWRAAAEVVRTVRGL